MVRKNLSRRPSREFDRREHCCEQIPDGFVHLRRRGLASRERAPAKSRWDSYSCPVLAVRVRSHGDQEQRLEIINYVMQRVPVLKIRDRAIGSKVGGNLTLKAGARPLDELGISGGKGGECSAPETVALEVIHAR